MKVNLTKYLVFLQKAKLSSNIMTVFGENEKTFLFKSIAAIGFLGDWQKVNLVFHGNFLTIKIFFNQGK
tara:strand:+ start:1589 stop:1795 length:207 start_codon:yes stop_codon:yes gene_type:complete